MIWLHENRILSLVMMYTGGLMLNLEKWGSDKSPILAMIAQQVVINAPDASEFFVDLRGDALKKLPTHPLNQWLPLYSQNHKIIAFMKGTPFCLTSTILSGLTTIKMAG